MDDAALGTCKRQSNFFSLIRILSIQDFSTCKHEERYQEDLPNSSIHQAGQQASTLLVEKRKIRIAFIIIIIITYLYGVKVPNLLPYSM